MEGGAHKLTDKTIKVRVDNKLVERSLYVGPKGARYIRKGSKFVSVKSIKKQHGGAPPPLSMKNMLEALDVKEKMIKKSQSRKTKALKELLANSLVQKTGVTGKTRGETERLKKLGLIKPKSEPKSEPKSAPKKKRSRGETAIVVGKKKTKVSPSPVQKLIDGIAALKISNLRH